MRELLGKQCKTISGRIKIVKAPAAATPTQVSLTLTPDCPILLDLVLFASPSAVLPNSIGVRISSGGRLLYPAFGSVDSSDFSGAANGWGALPTSGTLSIDELNSVLEGPPYNILFEFYNADTVNDAFAFINARVTPKIDLPAKPIDETADPIKAEQAEHEQPSYNRV